MLPLDTVRLFRDIPPQRRIMRPPRRIINLHRMHSVPYNDQRMQRATELFFIQSGERGERAGYNPLTGCADAREGDGEGRGGRERR